MVDCAQISRVIGRAKSAEPTRLLWSIIDNVPPEVRQGFRRRGNVDSAEAVDLDAKPSVNIVAAGKGRGG